MNFVAFLSAFVLIFVFLADASLDVSARGITYDTELLDRSNISRTVNLSVINSDFGSVESSLSAAYPGDEILIWIMAYPGFIITGSEVKGGYDWEPILLTPNFQIHRFIMTDSNAVFYTGFSTELTVDVESNQDLGNAWALSGASETHSSIPSAEGMHVNLSATAYGFERWEVIHGNISISSHFINGNYVFSSFIMPYENVRIRAIHVYKPPSITIYDAPNGMMGEAYGKDGAGFQFLADTSTAWTWSLAGTLPQGLEFDSLTGTISGIPAQYGTFGDLIIKAENVLGYDERSISITIDPPKYTNAIVTFGTTGAGGTLTASISGNPIESGSHHPIGSSVVFAASPANGFRVASWTVNGVTAIGDFRLITRSIAMAGLSISVAFERISYMHLLYPPNLSISGSNLNWSAVPEAVGYRLYINGTARTDILTETNFNLAALGLNAGTYSIQIRALGDNVATLDSSLSAVVSFIIHSQQSNSNSENETVYHTPSSTPRPTPIPTPAPNPIINNENEIVFTSQVPDPAYNLLLSNSPYIFIDISPNAWYSVNIDIVTSAGLFQGTGEGYFNPYSGMTRAMFAQVLANLGYADFDVNTETTSGFFDVSNDAWYFAAVEWAYSLGIVSGFDDGSFAPRNNITREQMAVMLFRFINIMDVEVTSDSAEVFTDQDTVSPWASEAVKAMQSMGFITGRPDGSFDPRATATRAEVATIFARFLAAVDNKYFP